MIGYATIMFDDEEEFTCLMMYAYKEDAKFLTTPSTSS